MPPAEVASGAVASQVGLDIGGTLAKVVVLVPDQVPYKSLGNVARSSRQRVALESSAWLEPDLTLRVGGGQLLFLKFLTSKTEQAVAAVGKQGLLPPDSVILCTGGGAFKYREAFRRLGARLEAEDEMDCLVRGLRIVAAQPAECFSLKNVHFSGAVGSGRAAIEPEVFELRPEEGLVLVNIGSGVSFLHVTDTAYSRVGGSSLGGSTFLGLVALLTGVEHFDDAIDLAANGDSSRVDMLVRDIYGEEELDAAKTFGLRPTTLASSFGKAINKNVRAAVRREDLALSCLVMLSMNVAALAHLHAKAAGARNIVFTGNFLARSGKTIKAKSYAKLGRTSELHLHKRNDIAMKTLVRCCSARGPPVGAGCVGGGHEGWACSLCLCVWVCVCGAKRAGTGVRVLALY